MGIASLHPSYGLLAGPQSDRNGILETEDGAARTVTAPMMLIGKLIKTFAPEQCANYFRHAGYA
jgi:hypothetical protein